MITNMISKISRTIAIVILAIMPFSTILSSFSPYWTSHSFRDFLIASVIFACVSIVLGWLVSGRKINPPGGLLFLLGLLIAPPFMLGTPETSPKLLERTAEEHFRFAMLILASVAFIAGFVQVFRHYRKSQAASGLVFIPLVICAVLLLWDNASSYNFSAELESWIASGKNAGDFFPAYDFHEFFRTLGRSLIYVLISWLAFIVRKEALLKKWQLIFLIAFCAVGIVFFFLTNLVGLQFYFPFMVPAIALAPAYWLGLMMITSRNGR